MDNIHAELLKHNIIDEPQFQFLEALRTKKIASLYHELRLMLYLGIMLFTGGAGYFAYQNIGSVGHIIAMTVLFIAIVVGFIFIHQHSKPYSHEVVTVNHAYYDYILLLVPLLVISLLTYVQVYFDLTKYLLHWSSYITSAIFFYMAYRYDNRALLSMGISTLSAAIGLSITPIDWAKGNIEYTTSIHTTSILTGLLFIAAGQISAYKHIKKHFCFTYQNFGLLLLFAGCIASMFNNHATAFFALATIISAGLVCIYSWKFKEFLFFIYGSIAGYIAVTYLLFFIANDFDLNSTFFIYYFPLTCIGYIVLLLSRKAHFVK